MNIRPSREIEKELKQFWKIDDLKFTGQFTISKQAKGYFRNVRTLAGNSCIFPDGNRVHIPANNIDPLEIDREYIIHAFVAPEPRRADMGVNYLLYLDTKNNPPKINKQSPKQYVQKLYNQYQAAEGILKDSLSGAIKRLAVETNKKAETFIYEILQNADDYPDPIRKRVNIRFKIIGNYLVVVHNGQPFKDNNVYAICSVATGDKERDINKTGYKGIGFKSIFKHSNFVWIHSGDFSFRFDEVYHKRKGNETFWQLIPIWTEIEAIENVVTTPDIINAPVSIIIKPKDGVGRLREYADIFEKVFQDERVLLFLRSVDSLSFQWNDKSFSKARSRDLWEISDLPEIDVPEELQGKINQIIDRGGDDRIPEKFKDLETTKITFATLKKDSNPIATQNTRIYAYLPTDLNFGLPFLVNGDFIPDGSREKLFWDLEWNKFLFKQAGYVLIKWLNKLYIKYQNASTTTLLPNLTRLITEELDEAKRHYIELFEEGFHEGIKEIPFVPDTKGNLCLLTDLTIDLTGLLDVMGEDSFRKCTGVDGPFMATSFATSSIVNELIVKYELGKKFTKDNILELISIDDFESWLKKPLNNIAFLKLLNTKGWVNELSQCSIYLTEESELNDADSTYYNLGQDHSLLNWMKIPVLHPKLRDAFRSTELLTLIYEPASFIDNFILKNQSDIDAKLEVPENNIKFYQYLFKYSAILSSIKFESGQLGYFKVIGYDERIINSISAGNIFFQNITLQKLLEENSIPIDHICLLDLNQFASGKMLNEWKAFFFKFGIKELTGSSTEIFIKDHITSEPDIFFKHFPLSGIETEDEAKKLGNAKLWTFLYTSLNNITKINEKEFARSVSELPVYVKGGNEMYSLKECYLPKEYTENETLEKLVEEHSDIQIQFVSDLYRTHKILSHDKWKSLFEIFHVKTDIKDLLLHYLVPEIDVIREENLIAVTRVIFEYRSFLKDQLPTLNLNIKTIDGSWLPAKETIIGPHYSGNSLRNNILPSFSLGNTISEEYSSTAIMKWNEFFQNLGAIEYNSEQELINAKIGKYIEDEIPLNEADPQLTFVFVKELVDLYLAEKLSDKNYESLKSMKILLKGDYEIKVYENANKCHFSKEYKPKLNIEEIVLVENLQDIFISPQYINRCGSLKDVKNFFKKIGVKEDFYFVKSEVKARKEADPAYILFIDNSNSKIKSNATSWASQHKIKPWIELPYLACLKNYPTSVLFWEKIASNEKFLKSAFECLQYHYYFPTVAISSYTEWYIKNTETVPARDGNCYKPSDLYSTKLERYIKNDSLLPKIDLKNVLIGDKTLEEHLGFKMNLTLDLCIERIAKLRDITRLKKEGIWTLFIHLLTENKLSKSDTASLKEFIQSGSLPNQLNEWRGIGELYNVQDDFNLGVGNSPHLIHDELKPIAEYLGVNGLITKDFDPEFKDAKNEQFKDILISRISYLALVESATEWETKAVELIDIVKPITFESTSRISFSYKKVNPSIENTEITFYNNNQVVYYVGNWRWARAAELFIFIHKLLNLKNVSLKILQDFLLLPETEILNFLDEKNIKYPASWRPKQQSPKNDTKDNAEATSEPRQDIEQEVEEPPYHEKRSELSDEETAELEALLNRRLSDSEMANTLIIALYRALKHYETLGNDVTIPRANIEECIRKRMLEGVVKTGTDEVIKVLVRSAKKGILHLNYQAWVDLSDANTELFVVTGNNSSDYRIFVDQKSLSSANKDSWVAKIGGDDKYAELSSLLNGEYLNPSKKFAPFQFLIRIKENGEYQSIFERIYSLERNPDFSELD